MQSGHFRDFDAFAASVRGVECTMMLQNPTVRLWDIVGVECGTLRVQQGRLGSGNIVEGQSHPDECLLYLPLTDSCAYSANAKLIEHGQMAILEPGCEFCVSTRHAHDWCTILVPAEFCDIAGESSPLAKTCRVTCSNHQLARRFRDAVQSVVVAAGASPNFETSLAARHAEATLSQIAADVLGLQGRGRPNTVGPVKLSRHEIIHRSIAFLESRGDKPISVGDLATAAGVSERTLRASFHEYFGTGPLRYLQLRRLHRVERALRAADPDEVNVTDVLVHHGEWEFGRFAARYRRHFGESPSETLRKSR